VKITVLPMDTVYENTVWYGWPQVEVTTVCIKIMMLF